jgi:Uncharacterised nucleotidyltransferase
VRERPLLLDLLTYIAAGSPSNSVGAALSLRLREADDAQLQWIVDAGLAPLLYRATREGADQIPSGRRDALLSADLTAQVRHANFVRTTNELIDTCRELRAPVTLLKGISISEQYYPEAHLRPMGDVDILVPDGAREPVECALGAQGYTRLPGYQVDETSHHGVPLCHPERHTWVEVHTTLFPKGTKLLRNELFSQSNLTAQTVPSTFNGKSVRRLSDELQLVYLASSWIRDLSRNRIHPSHAVALVDAVCLLRAVSETLNWDGLLGWMDNELASASLYLMLSYLSQRGLYQPAPDLLSRLESRQDLVRGVERAIIHTLVHRHLVSGRPFTRLFRVEHVWETLLAPGPHLWKLPLLPWNIVFPPAAPDRYRLRYHVGRIARRWRGEA